MRELSPKGIKEILLKLEPSLPILAPALMTEDRLTYGLNHWVHEHVERLLLAGLDKDAIIYDVGCGTGVWLLRLYERGYKNLVGFEVSSQRARWAGAILDHTDVPIFTSNMLPLGLNIPLSPHLITAFGFVFERGELHEKLAESAVDHVVVGTRVAFDWLSWEKEPKMGRQYEPVEVAIRAFERQGFETICVESEVKRSYTREFVVVRWKA